MSLVVVSVAVEQTAYHFDKPYAYLLENTLPDEVYAGRRVTVPFGRGNNLRNGIIISLSDEKQTEKMKSIDKLLDDEPVLSSEMLALADWIKEQTFCTLYEACKAMLPSGLNYHMQVMYSVDDSVKNEKPRLNPVQQKIVELIEQSGSFERERIISLTACDAETLNSLVKKGILLRRDNSSRAIGDATVRTVRLCVDENEEPPKLTPKQKSVYKLLCDAGDATVREICYFTGVSAGVINTLEKNGVVETYDAELLRTPDNTGKAPCQPTVLNQSQQLVYEQLCHKLEEEKPKPCLLFGVTGSGKTQVYLKTIERVLNSGRDVIVMVPEISLTPQTISIFKTRFGDNVAVFHSRLSMGERLDEWKRVKRKNAHIAIGTRSAVFAPFDNLGLIVIDEEQEHTYKSESSPRYHARDAARFRAAYNGALLLLASATPSVESFARAREDKYTLYKLSERFGTAVLPNVEAIDMRGEVFNGSAPIISRKLCELISANLEKNEQTILLLNRRGYNTYISCRKCGKVLTCENCSISMAYHKANGRLMCHYCGASKPLPDSCPDCGGEFIRMSGVGTQFAEDELKQIFPAARILRMDADTTMSRNAHSEKLGAFANGDYDILIGTQMVAKGLDFPNVTLVGVLNADQVMYSSDFRSYERAFSMLTQVIGRAGRSKKGIAVLQTVTPDNDLISLAAEQDYEKFYDNEIILRRVMQYPPYCDICMIGFVGLDNFKTENASQEFFEILKSFACGEYADVKIMVMGPSPAKVVKIGGKYRYRIIIKCKNSGRFRMMINKTLEMFGKKSKSGVTAYVDMNPEGII